MKTLYEEIIAPPNGKEDKTGTFRRWCVPLLWVAVPSALLGLFQLVKGQKGLMNGLIRHVTTPFKQFLARLCDLVPFAVAEVIWGLAILAFLLFLGRSAWLILRRNHKLRRLGRRVLALASALLIIYCGYTALWGINYYGDSFSDLSGIQPRGATVEELATLTAAFGNALNTYAGQVPRDGDSRFNQNVDDIFSAASGKYDGICQEFPFLEGAEHRPKQLLSSPIISRLDFTGFFFPFTGEALLNVDSPASFIPATILHELAHQRNIAPEDECNFVAILAGLRSGDPVYAYSAALLGFVYVGNALYSVSPATYQAIRGQLDDAVNIDLAENNAYWAQFDTKLDQAAETVSNIVYDGFLQSYDQTDGRQTYGKCVDLLVAYYFDHYWA